MFVSNSRACVGATSLASASAVSSALATRPHHGAFRPGTINDTTLYSNGADDQANAYTINSGYSVTNSFNLNANSTLNSVTFSNWLNNTADTATAVDWLITTQPFGGTTLGSGTAALTAGSSFINQFGFLTVSESFSLGGLSLGAGTYYLQLQNEVVSNGDLGFWGQSDGPSLAFQTGNGIGVVPRPSESFSISGNAGGPPPVPEPGTSLLLGTGLLAAGGAIRRKFLA